MSSSARVIPITVVTGFLGAGKTSLILSLLPQLAPDYKVVLLKNEFGDVEVDSKLAQQSSLTAVSEILNGCMCCILVGQMQTALLEIREKYHPDRIIIECSGSAFPATLAFQLRELEKQTDGELKLDAIVTVIDAENFMGYEDTSPTAKMQSSYTDIIVINKWEHVPERRLDIVLDHLNTLNDLTPKIRCRGQNGVDPKLIFGVETKLFAQPLLSASEGTHNEEVETLTIFRGPAEQRPHKHNQGGCECENEMVPADTGNVMVEKGMKKEALMDALKTLSKESVWRLKGFVRFSDGEVCILNWAFERFELTATGGEELSTIRLTAMGERGELKRRLRRFVDMIGAEVV